MEMPIYEFRPLPQTMRGTVLRYCGGEWAPDDGEYDLAFAMPDECVVYYVDLPYQKNIVWSWLDQHWQRNNAAHPRGNPWHYMLRDAAKKWGGDWGRQNHENTRAGDSGMSHVCDLRGCSNGRGPEFTIGDPWIARGLVRDASTKEVVAFPKKFLCMYCGEHDTPQESASLNQRETIIMPA